MQTHCIYSTRICQSKEYVYGSMTLVCSGWINDSGLLWINDSGLLWIIDSGLFWINDSGLLWINDSGLFWMDQ